MTDQAPDTRWPAGEPNEAEIRAELARKAEPVPCASTIPRGDLERLDRIVSYFGATAPFDANDMADDAWNIRNHLVPYKPGDEHYDPALNDEEEGE